MISKQNRFILKLIKKEKKMSKKSTKLDVNFKSECQIHDKNNIIT
jgi:hypothetical protein